MDEMLQLPLILHHKVLVNRILKMEEVVNVAFLGLHLNLQVTLVIFAKFFNKLNSISPLKYYHKFDNACQGFTDSLRTSLLLPMKEYSGTDHHLLLNFNPPTPIFIYSVFM
ncbi:hypothetical protein I3843_09G180200 [Carya illinoinensis]|nr:hypothetical protein I3843_09G180200 [Carya illinoinensis]